MTTPTPLGTIGAHQPLLVRQGATLGPFGVALLAGTAPVDLTGCTLRGQVRRTPSAAAVAAELQVTVTDARGGRFEWGLSAATTAALPAGADVTRPESLYHYDLELVDALGRVLPLLWGELRVHREVTRG